MGRSCGGSQDLLNLPSARRDSSTRVPRPAILLSTSHFTQHNLLVLVSQTGEQPFQPLLSAVEWRRVFGGLRRGQRLVPPGVHSAVTALAAAREKSNNCGGLWRTAGRSRDSRPPPRPPPGQQQLASRSNNNPNSECFYQPGQTVEMFWCYLLSHKTGSLHFMVANTTEH